MKKIHIVLICFFVIWGLAIYRPWTSLIFIIAWIFGARKEIFTKDN